MVRLGIWVQGLDMGSSGWVFGGCDAVGEEENIYSSVEICVSTAIIGIVKLPGRCLTTTTVR